MNNLSISKERIEPFFEYYLVGLLKPKDIANLLNCSSQRVSDVFRNLKRRKGSNLIDLIQRKQDFYYNIFENQIKENSDNKDVYYLSLVAVDDRLIDSLIEKCNFASTKDLVIDYFDFASPSYFSFYLKYGKYKNYLI